VILHLNYALLSNDVGVVKIAVIQVKLKVAFFKQGIFQLRDYGRISLIKLLCGEEGSRHLRETEIIPSLSSEKGNFCATESHGLRENNEEITQVYDIFVIGLTYFAVNGRNVKRLQRPSLGIAPCTAPTTRKKNREKELIWIPIVFNLRLWLLLVSLATLTNI
jgi:hypothetical protein